MCRPIRGPSRRVSAGAGGSSRVRSLIGVIGDHSAGAPNNSNPGTFKESRVVRGRPMIDRRGSADRRVAKLTEANARLRRRLAEQASFWRIAHQDPLTELWNRRYADERLAEELTRAQEEDGY